MKDRLNNIEISSFMYFYLFVFMFYIKFKVNLYNIVPLYLQEMLSAAFAAKRTCFCSSWTLWMCSLAQYLLLCCLPDYPDNSVPQTENRSEYLLARRPFYPLVPCAVECNVASVCAWQICTNKQFNNWLNEHFAHVLAVFKLKMDRKHPTRASREYVEFLFSAKYNMCELSWQ